MCAGQLTIFRCKRGLLFRVVAVLWLFACVFCASAGLTQWVHEQWQTAHGLPQNSVFCFAQDTNGFLWFGTENGLVQYDGARFGVFNQQTPPAIQHNFISSLLLARDGTVWAGTRTGGLVQYRGDSFDEPFPAISEER